jgi:hypothetical protein
MVHHDDGRGDKGSYGRHQGAVPVPVSSRTE